MSRSGRRNRLPIPGRGRSGRDAVSEPAPPASSAPSPGGAPAPASSPGAAPPPAPTAEEVAEELATVEQAHAEAILRRAVQLSDQAYVVAERLPVSSLEEVAAELQMPASAVAEALAEYRAGGLDPSEDGPKRTVTDRLVGPSQVTVRSRTGLDEREVQERLRLWLKRRHRLRTRVDAEGTVVAIRRRGIVTTAVRQVRGATGSAGLSGMREVRGAAVSVDDQQTMICVVADVGEQRTQSVLTGSAVAIGGSAVVGTVAAVTAPVTLVGVPVAVGTGWIISRLTHRRQLRRIREEVEITTDNVAAGATPTSRVQEVAERLSYRIRE